MHLARRHASSPARALALLACALLCLFGQVAAARPSFAEIGMDMFFRAATAGVG